MVNCFLTSSFIDVINELRGDSVGNRPTACIGPVAISCATFLSWFKPCLGVLGVLACLWITCVGVS